MHLVGISQSVLFTSPRRHARSLAGVCQRRRCHLRGGAVSDDVVVVIVVWRVSRDGDGGSCLVARIPPPSLGRSPLSPLPSLFRRRHPG